MKKWLPLTHPDVFILQCVYGNSFDSLADEMASVSTMTIM